MRVSGARLRQASHLVVGHSDPRHVGVELPLFAHTADHNDRRVENNLKTADRVRRQLRASRSHLINVVEDDRDRDENAEDANRRRWRVNADGEAEEVCERRDRDRRPGVGEHFSDPLAQRHFRVGSRPRVQEDENVVDADR